MTRESGLVTETGKQRIQPQVKRKYSNKRNQLCWRNAVSEEEIGGGGKGSLSRVEATVLIVNRWVTSTPSRVTRDGGGARSRHGDTSTVMCEKKGGKKTGDGTRTSIRVIH